MQSDLIRDAIGVQSDLIRDAIGVQSDLIRDAIGVQSDLRNGGGEEPVETHQSQRLICSIDVRYGVLDDWLHHL